MFHRSIVPAVITEAQASRPPGLPASAIPQAFAASSDVHIDAESYAYLLLPLHPHFPATSTYQDAGLVLCIFDGTLTMTGSYPSALGVSE